MPKIKVREVDNTGTVSSSETPNIVYIPVPAPAAKDSKLFTSASKFAKAVENGDYTNGTMSSKMVYHLLTLGMQVLVEGLVVSGGTSEPVDIRNTVKFDEDDKKFVIDGIEFTIANDNASVSWVKGDTSDSAEIAVSDNIYSAELSEGVIDNLKNDELMFDFITNTVYFDKEYTVDGQPDWTNVFSRLEDKNHYNLRFLTTGQFFAGSVCGVDMVTCAAKRCDAVALLDFKTSGNAVSEYRNLSESVVNAIESEEFDTTKEPATFAAAFAPSWKGRINTPDGSEEIENLPPAFAYLCAFARSVRENPLWYAVAGSFRGVIPELVEVDKEYTTSEVEMLQARAKDEEVALDGAGDNVGVAINPIAYRRPFGHIIWGNRTLRDNPENESDSTGEMKATSFLNCRVLSTEVAKVAYEAANKYTFEQNSEVLWLNFTSSILPTLDRMSTGNGILDYKISRVATDKKARLCARISLIPIEAVEDFDITIELADSIAVSE